MAGRAIALASSQFLFPPSLQNNHLFLPPQWRMRHPPRTKQLIAPSDYASALRSLADEQRAHEATRKEAQSAWEEWEERMAAHEVEHNATVHTSIKLEALLAEVQTVLREALDATSWTECRQLLYHESLRYCPTAATHGRGDSWTAQARLTQPRLRSSFVEALNSKLLRQQTMLQQAGASTPFRSRLVKAGMARSKARAASGMTAEADGIAGHGRQGVSWEGMRVRGGADEPSVRAVAAGWSGSLRSLRGRPMR